MSKHTKGPWSAYYQDIGGQFGVEMPNLVWRTFEEGKEIARANARLISAAPEMFLALKDALLALNHPDLPGETAINIIEKAIAKAEGRDK